MAPCCSDPNPIVSYKDLSCIQKCFRFHWQLEDSTKRCQEYCFRSERFGFVSILRWSRTKVPKLGSVMTAKRICGFVPVSQSEVSQPA